MINSRITIVFKIPAVIFLFYWPLTSCNVSEKNNKPFPRYLRTGRLTDYQTDTGNYFGPHRLNSGSKNWKKLFQKFLRKWSKEETQNRTKKGGFPLFPETGIFFQNRASQGLLKYYSLSLCKKLAKSLKPFLSYSLIQASLHRTSTLWFQKPLKTFKKGELWSSLWWSKWKILSTN